MADSAAGAGRKDLRASDTERERFAEILRDAAAEGRLGMDELDERLGAVYAAKTHGELEPIVRDLPEVGSVPVVPCVPAVPAASAGPADRFAGVPTSKSAFACMGGFSRRGRWTVPGRFTAIAIMGGGGIDMRDARFAGRTVTIRVFAIMGGVGITVPEDAEVHASGVGLMGGFSHGPADPGVPGGPVIRIKGLALMGGVGINRKAQGSADPELRTGPAACCSI
jgi:Domain of unknown function (DUF1707)